VAAVSGRRPPYLHARSFVSWRFCEPPRNGQHECDSTEVSPALYGRTGDLRVQIALLLLHSHQNVLPIALALDDGNRGSIE